MPSLARRREEDSRAPRLESTIRDSEMAAWKLRSKKGLPQCSKCLRTFEEESKFCPWCDTKTVGHIRPIPEKFQDEATRGAIRRARAKIGL